MNIAVIAKTRLPIAEPFRGGLEAFTYAICQEYIRLGHDITLYAHPESDKNVRLVSFQDSSYPVREDPTFEIVESDEYLSIVQDIQGKPFDIVHNNSMHELPLVWGVSANIPVVTTLHAPPQYGKMKPAITATSGAQNLHFVAVSAALGKTWSPYLQNGFSVIHNGVDLQGWPLVRKTADYLFWFGRIVPQKGLDIALDVAHAANMPLRFAGSKDDEDYYDKQIQPRIHKSDTYLGHVDQHTLSKEMQGAAVLVNSARWDEPFGLTNIEAMSSGVPVVGFDKGAFTEIVTAESGVVANDATVTALAEAAMRAKKLPSEGVRARAQTFSITNMAEQYVAHFRDLL